MTAPALFDMAEVVQRNTARARLRTLLADGRWHATSELLRVAGSGVSSRVKELRRGADGWPAAEIVCECHRPGRYRYRLIPAACDRCGASHPVGPCSDLAAVAP